ncbi:hypothetical protein RQP46_008150 [Phenoliferia psychrophenolica]
MMSSYGDEPPVPFEEPPPLPPLPLQPLASASQGLGSASASKRNPLVDLLETERLYVEDLGVIIKKCAGAWSRSRFPPPELDAMFRAIEAVYRTDKGLLAKLTEIGPNPASPKALGDVLMRWITDLEPAYTRFANTYSLGFDQFEPVQSNEKLAPILAALPYPATLPQPSDSYPPQTSLDALFSLPAERLVYFKRLYARLLKSTQEGRSDHALLVAANERLDVLLDLCDQARTRSVLPEAEHDEQHRSSGESVDSPGSSDRNSSTTTATSTGGTPKIPSPPRIEDLERRLHTGRALDIFTLLPKKCKLQIAPPNLPFTRQLRRAADVPISFIPRCDPTHEVLINRGHIILLSDLFLVCERMTDAELIAHSGGGPGGEGGADLWLKYPPLAGKHLSVREGGRPNELEVTVMKKEVLTLRTESYAEAQEWREAFEAVIEFGGAQPLTVRTAVSPTNAAVPSGYSTGFSPLALSPDVRGSELPSPPRDFHSPPSFHDPPPPPPPRDERRDWEDGRGDRPPRSQSNPSSEFASPASVPRPPRKQSMPSSSASSEHGHAQGAPLPRSASSGSYMHGNGSGAYEDPNQRFGGGGGYGQPQPFETSTPPLQYGGGQYNNNNNLPAQPNYSNQPLPSHYAPPPRSQHSLPPSPNEFGYPSPAQSPSRNTPSPHSPHPGYRSQDLQKDSSARSHASYSSDRTDRSSQYPDPYPYAEPPPPLPGKAYPNGGGYGNNVPTSRRTDPGRQSPGRGSLLSPGSSIHRSRSADALGGPGRGQNGHFRAPSLALDLANSTPGSMEDYGDNSPPPSPKLPQGPTKTVIAAQMRCKAFLQQHHAQWKSLGTAKLKVFVTEPINTKQLVVESDKSDKKVFVSTMVLTDGVERVGKTGVAIELSDEGQRTGIIYMLQMKTEQAATGLFDELLKGSDRATRLSRHSGR